MTDTSPALIVRRDTDYGSEQVTFTPSEAAAVSAALEDLFGSVTPVDSDSDPPETYITAHCENHYVSANAGTDLHDDDECTFCGHEWDSYEWYYEVKHKSLNRTQLFACRECAEKLRDRLDDFAARNAGDALGDVL